MSGTDDDLSRTSALQVVQFREALRNQISEENEARRGEIWGSKGEGLNKMEASMGLKWLIFLIGPLDLIGMWFGEDQRANILKTHV